MGRRVSIPVRVIQTAGNQRESAGYEPRAAQSNHRTTGEERSADSQRQREEQPVADVEMPRDRLVLDNGVEDSSDVWRDRALRLQAEMDNYRKRQRRWAQDQIAAERESLLRRFLEVVDDLERALAAPLADSEALRQGIQMTHRAARNLLQQEGVTPIDAEGQPFDPAWHEAVATVGRDGTNVNPDRVVQVLEPGYRLGEQPLRPAKVVVAV